MDVQDNTPDFYPSRGCHELITNILNLIGATEIVLQLNTALESAYIDVDREYVQLKTENGCYTTSKVVITPSSFFHLENITPTPLPTNTHKAQYFHLYLLIADSMPQSCTYRSDFLPGVLRWMNLTPFVGLNGTGMKLFVFQTYGEDEKSQKHEYLAYLKQHHVVSEEATLLCADSINYEQIYQYSNPIYQLPHAMKPFFEVLNTSHIQQLAAYIPRWKMTLKPYPEELPKISDQNLP